jgi:hypothetical protein
MLGALRPRKKRSWSMTITTRPAMMTMTRMMMTLMR